jgi:hypothetical protein
MRRQAVVVIHGMGEQLPLETLTRFVDAALAPDAQGERHFYSRPESVTGSFESRRFLVPRVNDKVVTRPQTEFFEYHWSDRMQGNRLDDLWPTFRRMLLCRPSRVPSGLRFVWVIAWLLILTIGWAVGWGPLSGVWREEDNFLTSLVGALVSSAAVTSLLSYVLSRLLPRWLTRSFVDVVRYLDTSPRSYGVRREIRRGLVEMLQALHAETDGGRQRYDRIVIVAHSLGAFIAYDAIAYLWGLSNARTSKDGPLDLSGLSGVEEAAARLESGVGSAVEYQEAQAILFEGLRATGNSWRISDLVTVGTPMYFADRLIPGRGALAFERRKERHELPTCPPLLTEGDDDSRSDRTRYSWRKKDDHQVLHESVPFTVVRWTNLYFPSELGFFGDWFGGPLAPLFGAGIRDIKITGNTPRRRFPALAHALYFRFPEDIRPDSVTTALRNAMALSKPRVDDPGTEASSTTRPQEVPNQNNSHDNNGR